MPKVVQNLLGVVLGLPLLPGWLAMMAFPVVLAVKSPSQATADFLGLILVGGGALLVAREVSAWQQTHPRTVHALIHPSPQFWVGLLLVGWGGGLCLFNWPPKLVDFPILVTSLVAGLLLYSSWLLPIIWEARKHQRAQQAQAPAQPREPFPQRALFFLVVWMVLGSVIGYGLLLLTLNGQLSTWLTAYLSYLPLFGLVPIWVGGLCIGLAVGYNGLIYVPASLRVQPRRQRFLFLLARKTFGVTLLCYGLLISLEFAHALSQEQTDRFFALVAALAGMTGLTYLAAWIVAWLIRWREARQHEA